MMRVPDLLPVGDVGQKPPDLFTGAIKVSYTDGDLIDPPALVYVVDKVTGDKLAMKAADNGIASFIDIKFDPMHGMAFEVHTPAVYKVEAKPETTVLLSVEKPTSVLRSEGTPARFFILLALYIGVGYYISQIPKR